MPNPPFWEDVGLKKWAPFADLLEVPVLSPENGHYWRLKLAKEINKYDTNKTLPKKIEAKEINLAHNIDNLLHNSNI